METILLISSILLWVFMLFNILLTIGLARRIKTRQPQIEMLKVGQVAPDFRAFTLQGQPVTFADYVGRALAFVFISPHCRPCRDEIPKIEKLQPEARQLGVEIVMVSDVGEEETQAFIEEFADQIPTLVAPRERTPFLIDYMATATPSYCLVNSGRIVQAVGLGLSELDKKISLLSLPKEVIR
jgi:peroxiredoxin